MWCANRKAASIDAPVCSCSPWAIVAIKRYGCWFSDPARGSGPRLHEEGLSPIRRSFAASTGAGQSPRKAVHSFPTSTPPPSIPSIATMLAHYSAVALPCRIQDPDRKGKVGTRRRTRQGHTAQGKTLRELAGRASLSGSLGNELGGYAHSWHHRNGKWPPCSQKKKPTLLPLPGRTVPLLPVRRTGGASGWL